MIDKGQSWEFGQDTGVTSLLFTRSAMGFLMTTKSQDLGLTSHPKDGWRGKIYGGVYGGVKTLRYFRVIFGNPNKQSILTLKFIVNLSRYVCSSNAHTFRTAHLDLRNADTSKGLASSPVHM